MENLMKMRIIRPTCQWLDTCIRLKFAFIYDALIVPTRETERQIIWFLICENQSESESANFFHDILPSIVTRVNVLVLISDRPLLDNINEPQGRWHTAADVLTWPFT